MQESKSTTAACSSKRKQPSSPVPSSAADRNPKRRKTSTSTLLLSVDSASASTPRHAGLERTLPRPQIKCTDCSDTLVLCWGDKRRPYLRHMNKSTDDHDEDGKSACAGHAGETLLHKMAKSALVEFLMGSRSHTIKTVRFCDQCGRSQHHQVKHSIPDVEWVQERKLDNGGFADVAAVDTKTNKVVCVLEVVVTHKTEASARSGYEWYEFCAFRILDCWDRAATGTETASVSPTVEKQPQPQSPRQWVLTDQKPPAAAAAAGRPPGCGHRLCLSNHAIAVELGYVQSPYPCEARMFIDVAVRGQITDTPVWNTHGGGPMRMCRGNEKRASVLLAEIVRRSTCLRCGLSSRAVSAQQPFCLKCYQTTHGECQRLAAWRNGRGRAPDRHDVPIERAVRSSVLQQLEWLEEIPGTKEWKSGTPCSKCDKAYLTDAHKLADFWEPAIHVTSSPSPDGASGGCQGYVTGHVWWFGIKKHICTRCLQAEWEARKQQLWNSVQPAQQQAEQPQRPPPVLTGI